MQNLIVSFIQTDLVWNSPQENLDKFERIISKQALKTDLILLPEMFTSGFSVDMDSVKKIAAYSQNTISWLRNIAIESSATIAGSIIVEEDKNYFNRIIWMENTGEHKFYDKRHTFSYGLESDVFKQGIERKIFNINGWRVLPQVCYDLRFPVWARNQDDYDLFINLANWPKVRRDAWNTLLKARAIENLAFTVGVNRIGTDPNLEYAGDSKIHDPWGELVLDAKQEEGLFTFELNADRLIQIRNQYPFLKDRDSFEIKF
ncbi:MAG: hypothetical protein KDD56_00690 [Bdellovibrionales bacterium]|nr:hypothetical protein [Bdellovibrionales bacterium]